MKKYILMLSLLYSAFFSFASPDKFSVLDTETLAPLVGYWEQEGNANNYMRVFAHGGISLDLSDSSDFCSLGGKLSVDKNNLYIKLNEDSYFSFSDQSASSVAIIPYIFSKNKAGKIISVTLTVGKKRFSLKQISAYNLSVSGWEERTEVTRTLTGKWENGDSYVVFSNGRMDFFCKEGETWCSACGLYTAKNDIVYMTLMDYTSSDNTYKSGDMTIPYIVFAGENEEELMLRLTIEGNQFLLTKSATYILPLRRQTMLNGIWKSEKTWQKPSDCNMTLQFADESFLVTIEGSSFSYSLLGDVFYENGMMYLSEINSVESIPYDSIENPPDFGNERINSVYDYAAYYELPEYIFFGAQYDTPYHALCNYKVSKNELILTAYGKDLKLQKQVKKLKK